MSYIKQILDYFFKNDVPENLKSRVYKRLVSPINDEERDRTLESLWNELETDASTDWEKAYSNVESVIHKKEKKTIRLKPLQYWSRIAAIWFVPLVMFCGSVYFYMNSFSPAEETIPEVSYVQYYAEEGKREQVTLPDGSTVWLNSGSTLICPSTFATTQRGVYLLGEGFFDVVKDSSRPFVVDTHFLKMQVLGTTFNVSAYPDDTQIRATLETGALKVILRNDTAMSYLLQPDNQLVYTPSTSKVECLNVKASDYSDWRMGGLLLNNIKFEDAMNVIKRAYGVKIHIRTSVYNNQKIYVHYNKNESLENVFHILKIMIPELEYKISDKSVYIE